MDQKNANKVAENSKSLVKKYVAQGNFGRAFSHYLVILNLRPDWKYALKEEFFEVLCKWGMILHEKKKFNDLFKCYEQAIEIFPNNEIIFNNLGSHLLRCGLLKEAAYYYRKCQEVKPHFIRASFNLENVFNLAVERWHFRMLNDNYRNESFRKAILKRIRQGFDRVLDIGTGTGILSMFCAEGKAKEIYACDSSSIMIEIAEKVFQRNNAKGIKLINKHSSKLQLPTDIPRRVSLVITETVDSGLFGEDILFTLLNAWENLLLPPCNDFQNLKNSDNFGCVIPFGAIIYLTAIECDIISNALYLKETNNLFTFQNCNIYQNNEDYDTQDLKRVPFKYLTDIKKVFSINFNDPCLIREVLYGERVEIFKLKIKKPGRLDCFAVWFDLLLDENIVLNTGPKSESNAAWDQAIFSLPKCMFVESSQEIIVEVSVKNGKLNVKCNEKFGEENKKVFEPTQEVIKTLNNEKLVESFRQVEKNLSKVFDYPVRIMDCFPFPIFGLNFLMSRGKHFPDMLTCFVRSEKDRELVNFLAKENNIKERILIMAECDFESYCESNKGFDIILLDFVEMTGELKEQISLKMPYLRSILNRGGVILPEDITVVGQFIYSDWLIRTSRVISADLTCGHEIGEFINFYQVLHFIDINFDIIEKNIGTNAFELFSLYSCEEPKQMSVTSFSSHINAMIYWFKIRFMKNCDEIYTYDKTSRYHQSAFLFPKIKTSHEIEFFVIRNDGLFKTSEMKYIVGLVVTPPSRVRIGRRFDNRR